ncbi:hypothetical protein [Phytohabitans houttuyneae]|uniref:Uncharacterized protein n=1 Tax=Phytohabitans houttuyneae TaxID=1076126 RepID=A0A6V8K336_9ACTN|nr:hypothetical protein [Phytohabitans houttuyneae]GFJ79562.1 hypothetical protein Phou_037420 [Phytohabitans houttuyneae]
MTDLPTMTSPQWTDPATVASLAAGLDLADPVTVLVPPDGSCWWQERCSICLLTRAEDSLWEPHAIARRRAYAKRNGTRYDLSRCGKCGTQVGPGGVQKDGLRYCDAACAAPHVAVVPRASMWAEVDGVLVEVFEPAEPVSAWGPVGSQ